MKKIYILSFACFRPLKNFTNYQLIEAKSKKQAIEIALNSNDLKGAKVVPIFTKKIKRKFANLIIEHNKEIEVLKGESNE